MLCSLSASFDSILISWLNRSVNPIFFIWNFRMLYKLFTHIIIILWIWFLFLLNLDRNFSVMLYWLILFWYLYCCSSGFIDWFNSITLKLDKFELFKSMIFNFFAVLLSFFLYINNMSFYMSSGHFASDNLSTADIILSSHSSFIFFLHFCCFYCIQYQHHDSYIYSCWFSFFSFFQFILIYFSSFICALTDLSSICY